MENDFKNFVKNRRTVDTTTSRSRTTSCGSERPALIMDAENNPELTEQSNKKITINRNLQKKIIKKSLSHTLLSEPYCSQCSSEHYKFLSPTVPNSNIIRGTFAQFDPLRTLHFLSKELQSKLYTISPDESVIHEILVVMQHLLHRLPIPSKSDISSGNTPTNMHTTFPTRIVKRSQKCHLTQIPALVDVHQCCQTNQSLQVQQKAQDFELKLMELELVNKALTADCALANSERDQMAEKLKYHESNNKFLQKEIDELKKQLSVTEQVASKTEEIIEELMNKNKILEEEQAALMVEFREKLLLAEQTLEHVKDTKLAEYSENYKYVLNQKDALIKIKSTQLDNITKQLANIQSMLNKKISVPEMENQI